MSEPERANMSSDNSTPTDASAAPAPGAWTIDRLIAAYEAVMQEETGNDDWSFNDGQRQAIREGDRPVHVTAGPGSGKSEVSIARVAKWLLVDGEPPRSIVPHYVHEKSGAEPRAAAR